MSSLNWSLSIVFSSTGLSFFSPSATSMSTPQEAPVSALSKRTSFGQKFFEPQLTHFIGLQLEFVDVAAALALPVAERLAHVGKPVDDGILQHAADMEGHFLGRRQPVVLRLGLGGVGQRVVARAEALRPGQLGSVQPRHRPRRVGTVQMAVQKVLDALRGLERLRLLQECHCHVAPLTSAARSSTCSGTSTHCPSTRGCPFGCEKDSVTAGFLPSERASLEILASHSSWTLMLSLTVLLASRRIEPRSMSPLAPSIAPEAGRALPPSWRVSCFSDARPAAPIGSALLAAEIGRDAHSSPSMTPWLSMVVMILWRIFAPNSASS